MSGCLLNAIKSLLSKIIKRTIEPLLYYIFRKRTGSCHWMWVACIEISTSWKSQWKPLRSGMRKHHHYILVCHAMYYHRSRNFRCKNSFVVCVNHKNKKHVLYYFTTDDRYSQHILYTQFQHSKFLYTCMVSQLASYFAWDGLFFDTSRWLVANAWQLSQCPINCPSLLPQYVPTPVLGSLSHTSSLPIAVW